LVLLHYGSGRRDEREAVFIVSPFIFIQPRYSTAIFNRSRDCSKCAGNFFLPIAGTSQSGFAKIKCYCDKCQGIFKNNLYFQYSAGINDLLIWMRWDGAALLSAKIVLTPRGTRYIRGIRAVERRITSHLRAIGSYAVSQRRFEAEIKLCRKIEN
jgi:hypothetical protein